MDVTDFGRALRRFWPLSVAMFVLTVAAGYLIATAGGPSYTATATISVSPRPAEQNSDDQIAFEIPVIVEQLNSRALRQQLNEGLKDGIMTEVDSLTAVRDIDTGIVRITAEGADRQTVAVAANAAAESIVAKYRPSDTDPETPATRGDLVVVEMIDTAIPDSGSGRPNFVPTMLATVALGAILAGVAAAVAQKFSQARDLEGRIRAEIGVPVLAVVPATRELNADEIDLRELLRTGPAPLVDAFQTLRSSTEILLRHGDRTLAISSWHRKEGRTTITAGLGLVLSALGQECVVVDGNLRKPDLPARLGEPGNKGLAEYAELGGFALVHHTRHPDLELVAAGVAEAHPAQILAVALPAALEEVRDRSPEAVVLIDAPPLGPVHKGAVQRLAETSIVLQAAQRVLLVIDASNTSLPELAVGVDRLQEDGVIVIGAVVNRRRRGRAPRHR